jgi:hypothetical protein
MIGHITSSIDSSNDESGCGIRSNDESNFTETFISRQHHKKDLQNLRRAVGLETAGGMGSDGGTKGCGEGGYPGSREACGAGEEELVRRAGAGCRRGCVCGHVAPAVEGW